MKKNFLMMGLIALSMNAMAGDKGNGGFIYKCGDKAELIDLMEVRHIPYLNSKIQIIREDLSYEEQVAKRIDMLKSVDGKLGAEIAVSIKDIRNELEMRRSIDNSIPNDLGYVPTVEGCKVRNVIQYGEPVLVDSELFNKLSNFDKAALMFHEALYLKARQIASYSVYPLMDSLPARRITAMLFAENFEQVKDDLKGLVTYYMKPFSREIPRQVKLRYCIDKKYLGERKDLVTLNERYFNKMKIKMKQYGTKLSHVTKGDEFALVNQRCDGSLGESFVAETVAFEAKNFFRLSFVDVYYSASKSILGLRKMLDGSLLISVIENEVVKEQKLVRSLEGRRTGEIAHPYVYAANISFDLKSAPVADHLRDYIYAR